MMQKRIRRTLLFGLPMVSLSTCQAQASKEKVVCENKMSVCWSYLNNRIHFEMSAPTNGWVAIGFNTSKNLTGTYLLMGRIKNGKAELVEHFTISQGNYTTLKSLGTKPQVADVTGIENEGNSLIRFSLPIECHNDYQKNLSEGKRYVMVLAYSLADDFQHHSIMRTSVNVEL